MNNLPAYALLSLFKQELYQLCKYKDCYMYM